MIDIGKKIRERRIELRMTQSQVAEKAGCNYVTVLHVENNRKCAFATVQSICEVLRLEITLKEYEESCIEEARAE
jgi:DNA-binding XRE family transcriptional regulator